MIPRSQRQRSRSLNSARTDNRIMC